MGIFEPTQRSNYMRSEAARWLWWMKNQTGVDGFRWDAAKHFDAITASPAADHGTIAAVMKPFGSNPDIVSVAEVVDSATNQDLWTNTANTDAGADIVGTFDFSLRSKLRDMVLTLSGFDMQSIPSAQQQNRSRTVPFVNNHDTFRPILATNGNYGVFGDRSRWDNSNELAGGHIDPREERLAAAYAIAFSVDGSPQIFFEDLFDLGTTGQRFTHLPTSETDLPANSDLVNIIWCHRNLRFKEGTYKVKTAAIESPIWPAGQDSSDLLVIERSQKAIIGINHNHDTWRSVIVRTDFAPGTTLHDYSGANSADIIVPNDQRVTITAPPAKGDGAVKRKGYTIWGPAGITGLLNTPIPTTQVWEMANDLGDSHPNSLGQGGGLAAADRSTHYVGQIQTQGASVVTIRTAPEYEAKRYRVVVQDALGTVAFDSGVASGTRTHNFTSPGTGEHRFRIFVNSDCPVTGNGGDPQCATPPTVDPTRMTVAVTYKGSVVATTSANPMGPNTVVNASRPVAIDAGKRGSDRFFYVEVPPGAERVTFAIAPLPGARGDADLFVKFGGQGDRISSDRRSQTAGSNSERIVVASPQPGGWYIDVSGASDYTRVKLVVTVD
jgi:alpha-amylase